MRSAGFTGFTGYTVSQLVEKKVTEGATHRNTPVSSISSWSLGAWAALHGKGRHRVNKAATANRFQKP